MNVLDAFRAFDYANNGQLSCSELYGGLDWLGLRVTPGQIYDIVRNIDKENTGMVNFTEFRDAFHDDSEGALALDTSSTGAGGIDSGGGGGGGGEGDDGESKEGGMVTPDMIQPKFMRELNEEANVDKGGKGGGSSDAPLEALPFAELKRFKFKIQKQSAFKSVWTSRGTMSRLKVSVWSPDVGNRQGALHKNRHRVCLGYFAAKGHSKSPRKGGGLSTSPFLLEVTDTDAMGITGSAKLMHAVEMFMPHPVRFRLIWSAEQGKQPIFAWSAEPPSDEFVALGVVCTNTNMPPSPHCMRLVPREWAVPLTKPPELIWNDGGADSSRPGSMWAVTPMQLAMVVAGHDVPRQGALYELKHHRFYIDSQGKQVTKKS